MGRKVIKNETNFKYTYPSPAFRYYLPSLLTAQDLSKGHFCHLYIRPHLVF